MSQQTIIFDDEQWQLVPRVPTPKMLKKALGATSTFLNLTGSKRTVNCKKMLTRYRAMLDAAPSLYDKPTDWNRESECARAEQSVVYDDDENAECSSVHSNTLKENPLRETAPNSEQKQ